MQRWTKKTDPYIDRETEKYEFPIPSREFILEYLEKRGLPASHAELCEEIGMETEQQIEALRRRLRAMERDGQLIWTRKKTYGLVAKMDLVCGRVMGHRDGYGFLILDDGGDDLYLTNRQMRQVFDGDRVVARVSGIDYKGRGEAVIVDVIERNTEQLVGRYFNDSGVSLVVPENRRINQDILISSKDKGRAKNGQYVVVDIVVQPTLKNKPQGRVTEILGDSLEPGMEIDVAIRSHHIPYVWSDDIVRETEQLPKEVLDIEKADRVNLSDLPFVTIDGEDAKDFDDAVYCEPRKQGGWTLYVAIADVSHYVQVHSALDSEAYKRGNSVYFPDFVVPMLPEALSNELCSLNPEVDRLSIVCQMTITAAGKIAHYKFFEGVIHSHGRLTYSAVGKILEEPKSSQNKSLIKQYKSLLPHLKNLLALYKILMKSRRQRGAIDFETQETQILFSDDRKIEKIVPLNRNVAHRIIEECMLCANVAAARFLIKHDLIGLFRIHDEPKSDKIENVKEFLAELGLSLTKSKKPSSFDYQSLLSKVVKRPDAHLIQTVLLRSMNQAIYSHENNGHFGLSYPAYTHFTSPIRRYPDLLVHRAIRCVIRSQHESRHVIRVKGAKRLAKKNIFPYSKVNMVQFGEHCSMTERRADDAVRDVVDWLKCHYISDKVGETFNGIISGVTGFGLFIELESIFVEGLLHVTALTNDYYHFDAIKHRLKGERSGATYRLGDTIRVTVARVDLDEKNIDFVLADDPKKVAKKTAQKKVRSKKEKYKKNTKKVNKNNKKRSNKIRSKK